MSGTTKIVKCNFVAIPPPPRRVYVLACVGAIVFVVKKKTSTWEIEIIKKAPIAVGF